jgi:hypothetical protein
MYLVKICKASQDPIKAKSLEKAKLDIGCFSVKHAAVRNIKDCLAENQNNMS